MSRVILIAIVVIGILVGIWLMKGCVGSDSGYSFVSDKTESKSENEIVENKSFEMVLDDCVHYNNERYEFTEADFDKLYKKLSSVDCKEIRFKYPKDRLLSKDKHLFEEFFKEKGYKVDRIEE